MISYRWNEMKYRILSLHLLFLLCLAAAQNLRRKASRVKGDTRVSRDRQLHDVKRSKIFDVSIFEPERTNAETVNEDPESFGLVITNEDGIFVENENIYFQTETNPLNTDSESLSPEVDPNDNSKEKGGYMNTSPVENVEPVNVVTGQVEEENGGQKESEPEIDPLDDRSEKGDAESRVDPIENVSEPELYPVEENGESERVDSQPYEDPVDVSLEHVEEENGGQKESEPEIDPLDDRSEKGDAESRVDPIENVSEPELYPVEEIGESERVDSQPYEDPVDVSLEHVEEENGGQKESEPEIDPLDDRSEKGDAESRVDPIENVSEPELYPVEEIGESERVDSQPYEDPVDVSLEHVEEENGGQKESEPEIDPLDDRSEKGDAESRVDPIENVSEPELYPVEEIGESERVDSQPYEDPVDVSLEHVEEENGGQNGEKYIPNREGISNLANFETEFLNDDNKQFPGNSSDANSIEVVDNSNASSLADSADNNAAQIYHEEYFLENFDNSTKTSIVFKGKGQNEEDIMDNGTEIVQKSLSNSIPEVHKNSDVSSGVGISMYQRSFFISSIAPLIHFVIGLI